MKPVPNAEGRRINWPISKIEKILPEVNIMEQKDWPAIIAFLKPRIISLDEFWNNVKLGFES